MALQQTFRIFAGLALVMCGLVHGGEPAVAQDWQAGAPEAWQQILAAAKKEGKVVIAGRPELAKPLSEAFKKDTGLNVDFLAGEGREQVSRLGREVRAGRVTIDLAFGGQSLLVFLSEGHLTPIKPQLILPGVTNPEVWTDGQIKWVDHQQMYLFRLPTKSSASPSSIPT